MKLAIHELNATCRLIAADDLQPAFKTLSRVSRILEQLNSAWDVLRTMTPSEYTQFRGALGQSSGLAILAVSHDRVSGRQQERRDDSISSARQAVVERLEAARHAPSLYDFTMRLLASPRAADRSGRARTRCIVAACRAMTASATAWLSVYREPSRFWELYELAEKLVDFEDYFRRWRFNHVTTVERIIGFKRGTGGTSGVPICARCWTSCCFPNSGRSGRIVTGPDRYLAGACASAWGCFPATRSLRASQTFTIGPDCPVNVAQLRDVDPLWRACRCAPAL